MPSEQVILNVPDAKLEGECYWVQTGDKTRFEPLEHESKLGKLVSTTAQSHGILSTMVMMIDSAESHIFLASFIIDCKEIEEALVRAATRLQGGVHVITNFGTSIYKDELEDNEDATLDRLTRLAEQGVYIREHTSCHAKFLVVDNKEALVTSANCNENALKRNLEVGFQINDSETVTSISKLFQHLWVHEARNHLRPQKGQVIVESIPWRYPLKEPPQPSGYTTWTRDTNHHLVDSLIDLVNFAEERLLVSTYHIRELTNSGSKSEALLSAFEKALLRGVKVDILYHATALALGRPAREWEAGAFTRLHRAGGNLVMKGYDHLHAKYVCVDGRRLCLFSANLDGEKGLESGVEVGISIKDPSIIKAVENWHNRVSKQFPYQNIWEPTVIELSRGNATELVELSHLHIQVENGIQNTIVQALQNLGEGPIALESRLEDRIERPFDSSKPSLTSNIIKHHGFTLNPLSLGLQPEGEGGFTIEAITHELAVHGYLSPGEVEVLVSWKLSDHEIEDALQDYLLPKLTSPKSKVDLKMVCKWASESFDVSIDLPFPNSIQAWREFIESRLGKVVWSDFALHKDTLVVLATDDEIRVVLHRIKPVQLEIEKGPKKRKKRVPIERIERRDIEKALRPISESDRLPKWAEWNNLGKLLPDKDWQVVKDGFQREVIASEQL